MKIEFLIGISSGLQAEDDVVGVDCAPRYGRCYFQCE